MSTSKSTKQKQSDLYMPNYKATLVKSQVKWPSSVITILTKYNEVWYTGIVEKSLNNDNYLIKFNDGSEGEFTENNVEQYKTTQCVNAIYNNKNYTGIVSKKIMKGSNKNNYFIVYQDGSEALVNEDILSKLKNIDKTATIQEVVWNVTDQVVNYKLTWDQDLNGSKISVLLTVDELFDCLNTPSTLKTSLNYTSFQLWGNKFTHSAFDIFNNIKLGANEHKLYYDDNNKFKGISYNYLVSQIHKFYQLFEHPTGLPDIPDHSALEKYKMTASNVRGRKALIGQHGLRIKPSFNSTIEKGSILGVYKGTICTSDEADWYEENADTIAGYKKGYQFTLRKTNLVVDPFIPGSPQSLLIYANDVSKNLKSFSKTNAVFEQNARFLEIYIYGMPFIILVTLKKLVAGDEIGVDYGPEYIIGGKISI
jgi:hypothetical protein